jgi:hypothetical protein
MHVVKRLLLPKPLFPAVLETWGFTVLQTRRKDKNSDNTSNPKKNALSWFPLYD